MFVALSKILDLVVAPLSWAILLLVAAALLRRRGGWPWGLAAAGAAVLWAFSCEAVAGRLVRAAEASARETIRAGVVYDAVVVLGGGIDVAASRARDAAELNDAADRVLRAYELWRDGRARRVLLSAGDLRPQAGVPTEAERLAARLTRWGVPADALLLETRSRNTRENAVETARIAAEHGLSSLVLVTSAAHMDRALGCFRAAGLAPDALPVDFRGGDGRGASWLPRAEALERSTQALRERAGRIVYRLAGYAKG